jgi:hypothetical protein
LKTLTYNCSKLAVKERLAISSLLSLFVSRLNAKWVALQNGPADLALVDADQPEGREALAAAKPGEKVVAVTSDDRWPNPPYISRPIRAYGPNGIVVLFNSLGSPAAKEAPEGKQEPARYRMSGRLEAFPAPKTTRPAPPPSPAPTPAQVIVSKPTSSLAPPPQPVQEETAVPVRVAVRWGPPQPVVLPPLFHMPGARIHFFGKDAHKLAEALEAPQVELSPAPVAPTPAAEAPEVIEQVWRAPEPEAAAPPLVSMPTAHRPVELHRPAAPVIGRSRMEEPVEAKIAAPPKDDSETPVLRPAPRQWRTPAQESAPELVHFRFGSLAPETTEPAEPAGIENVETEPFVPVPPAEPIAEEPPAQISEETVVENHAIEEHVVEEHVVEEHSAVEQSFEEQSFVEQTVEQPAIEQPVEEPALLSFVETVETSHEFTHEAPVEAPSFVPEEQGCAPEGEEMPPELGEVLENLSTAIAAESMAEGLPEEDAGADWWGTEQVELQHISPAAQPAEESLLSALKAIKASNQPSILEITGLPMVCVIPYRNTYFTTAPAARLETAMGTGVEVSWRACASEAEARQTSGTELSRQGSLEQLCWAASLGTTPQDTEALADQAVRLRRWPPLTESRERSKYVRYATLLSGAHASPRELAEITGEPLQEVVMFVHACSEMNLLDISGQISTPLPAAPMRTQGSGILRGMIEQLTPSKL